MAFSLGSLFKRQPPEPPVPQIPRDRYLRPDYWGRWVASQRKLQAGLAEGLKPYSDDPKKRTDYRFYFEWRAAIDMVRLMYSGGYGLAETAEAMAHAFRVARDLDADYRAFNPIEKPYGLYGWGYGSDYELMMERLCWLTCLFDRQALAEHVAHCNPPGGDRLFDLIAAATVEPGRPVASTLAFPKRWTLCLGVAEAAPEARPGLLVKAYKSWKRRQPDRALPPEGVTTVVDGSYKGYWAWEIALIAAVFEVDDLALKGEANYPADLVADYRARGGGGGRAV